MTTDAEDPETIFLVFASVERHKEIYNKAFYTYEKACKYCDEMNKRYICCKFVVREEEIE